MKINVYEGKTWGKDGNVKNVGETRAFTRVEAAHNLRCFKEDITLVKAHVPLLQEEVISRIFITHHPAHMDKAIAHVNRHMGVSFKTTVKKKRKK